MPERKELPKVGVGVIIVNERGEILVGRRKKGPAQFYSIPGGHLELGETFEAAAKREIKEETNLDIENPQVVVLTNNLATYQKEGVHYISVILLAKDFSGSLENREPNKCEAWLWVDPKKLPLPHFDASQRGVEGYLSGNFYKKYE